MFYGGTIEQWVDLGLYMLLMLVLFTGIFAVSCIITNKVLHKRKNELKTKNKKKNYFIDVA